MSDRGARRTKNLRKVSVWVTFFLSCFLIIVGTSFLSENVTGESVRAYLLATVGIGINAVVLPNESNIIALQLEEKDLRLQEQAVRLNERERAFEVKQSSEQKLAPWFILGGLLLFGLTLLNFYLDFRRRNVSQS